MSTPITTQYFRAYRSELGFTNQKGVKDFFGGKDITPTVDFNYISLLNDRLVEIVKKINSLVSDDTKIANIDKFCDDNINSVFKKLKEHDIIQRLNNQGRRPEQVYFSWMRGYIISNYFLKALSIIFEVDTKDIKLIGDDDLVKIESFKRTPTADLEISLKDNSKVRIEMQSGFQGINDIKQHKVLEAKKIMQTQSIPSIAIHFDLFNGQVAFVELDAIKDDDMHWISRLNVDEGVVFNIDQNYFIWDLTKELPIYSKYFLEKP